MSTKHTPGPWRVTSAGGISGSGEVIILNVEDKERECSAVNNGFGRAKANAALIAAAPELLEACKDMIGFITHTLPAAAWQSQPWLRPAQEAIAKAEVQS